MAQASYIAFKPSTACGGRLTPAEVRRRSARCTASALAGLQTSPEFAAWDGARRRRARLWRACKFGVALAAALAVLPLAVLALATLEAPAASPHQVAHPRHECPFLDRLAWGLSYCSLVPVPTSGLRVPTHLNTSHRLGSHSSYKNTCYSSAMVPSSINL